MLIEFKSASDSNCAICLSTWIVVWRISVSIPVLVELGVNAFSHGDTV